MERRTLAVHPLCYYDMNRSLRKTELRVETHLQHGSNIEQCIQRQDLRNAGGQVSNKGREHPYRLRQHPLGQGPEFPVIGVCQSNLTVLFHIDCVLCANSSDTPLMVTNFSMN